MTGEERIFSGQADQPDRGPSGMNSLPPLQSGDWKFSPAT